MRKILDSIIVKPVGALCNLRCDYCFYLEKGNLYDKITVMSDDTLENLLTQMSAQTGKQYSITWQGGEPTLAGLEFYQKVVDMQIALGEKEAKTIGNSLQTNGTLLNGEWIEFLAKYNFLVGLSLDGPKELHDISRVYKNGEGSWNKVVENGRKMMKAGVAVNILSCITANNVQHPDTIYDFFKKEGYGWLQFNPVCELDQDGNPFPVSVDPLQYGRFMCRMFDRWYHDFTSGHPAPVIRFIENVFHAHIGKQVPECSFQKQCGVYLLVEHNGDVYNCDFFVNKENTLGNIHKKRMFDMLNSKEQQNFGREKARLSNDCYNCKWLKMCYGGCKKYRQDRNNKNYFCPAYKLFFEYSSPRFMQLAEWWHSQNPVQKNSTFDASPFFK